MSRDVHISERAAGLTAYYFAGKLAEIRRRMAEGQDIVNLGVGSPDLAPAGGVVDAVRRGQLGNAPVGLVAEGALLSRLVVLGGNGVPRVRRHGAVDVVDQVWEL